tara:strand:- start:229 stop:432 length:204 start_codon:yes stop_codon:yes gene_type:complete
MNFTTIIRFFLIVALISSCDNKSEYKSYYQDGKLKLEGNYIDEKKGQLILQILDENFPEFLDFNIRH